MPTRRLAATSLLFLAACAEQAPISPDLRSVDAALTFAVIAGDAQSGPIGEELPQALVVQVLRANGRPALDQLVNFRVRSGGGTMWAGASMTNRDGIAQDYWTLGPDRGAQQVEVVAVDPSTGAKQVFATFNATALVPASLAIAAGDSVNFGSVAVGASSAVHTITIVNGGDQASGALSMSIAGLNPADFQIVSDACTGQTLAGSATCDVTVRFQPASAGLKHAIVLGEASPGGVIGAALTGTGTQIITLLNDDFSGPFPGSNWTIPFAPGGTSIGPVGGVLTLASTVANVQTGVISRPSFNFRQITFSVLMNVSASGSGLGAFGFVTSSGATVTRALWESSQQRIRFTLFGGIVMEVPVSPGFHTLKLIVSGDVVSWQVDGATVVTRSGVASMPSQVFMELFADWMLTAPGAPATVRFDDVLVRTP